jgi:hypothetical protein
VGTRERYAGWVAARAGSVRAKSDIRQNEKIRQPSNRVVEGDWMSAMPVRDSLANGNRRVCDFSL